MYLDSFLPKLKAEGHRVLIYFQMTKMMEIMEEYLTFRQHSYLRLDGQTTIEQRRDLVGDWQTKPDLFIFILSTRAGGLGINLTAADTVIFYDSGTIQRKEIGLPCLYYFLSSPSFLVSHCFTFSQ